MLSFIQLQGLNLAITVSHAILVTALLESIGQISIVCILQYVNL